MFNALIRLVGLIVRILSGEKLERPDKEECRFAFFFLATFPLTFFFYGWLFPGLPKTSDEKTLRWLLFTPICVIAYFIIQAIGKRVPLVVSLFLNFASWTYLVLYVWKH